MNEIDQLKRELAKEFEVQNLGLLRYLLVVELTRSKISYCSHIKICT